MIAEILDKKRMAIVSLIMSILVVTLHIDLEYFYKINESVQLFDRIFYYIFYYFQHGICRVAVPFFMFRSAYLYYINYDGSIKKYIEKTKRRFFTLFIPYVIWNFINWLFTYTICNIPIISYYVANRQYSNESIISILLFRAGYKPNWFLEALIIFSIITPIFYRFLKNKIVPFIMIIVFIYLYICIDNDLIYGFCFYLIGILFSLHLNDIRVSIDNKIFFFLFFLSSLFIVLVGYQNRVIVVLEIISAICIWFAIPLLPKCQILKLDISFLIYETHEIVFSSISKLLYIMLPVTYFFGYINYAFTIIFGLFISYCLFSLLKKICNKLYLFIGGR